MASMSTLNTSPIDHSLVALLLLVDPVSTLLDEDRMKAIAAIAAIGPRQGHGTATSHLQLLRHCGRDLHWLRPKLKQAFMISFEAGDIDAAAAQRVIDRFELWSA
jgi:hypothetical protein